MGESVGEFRETHCALCGGKITRADALYPNILQVLLEFGAVAHRRCFLARYSEGDHSGATNEMIEKQTTFDIEQVGAVSERQ